MINECETESNLWPMFDLTPFEAGIAVENSPAEEVLRLLDYPSYFDLIDRPLPENRQGILVALSDDRLIEKNQAGSWNITNLGGILFAKQLELFPHLRRKAIRLVVYKGNSRLQTLKEHPGVKGYAADFAGLIAFINNLIPTNEIFGPALRKNIPMYPEIALRELVANAIIHQDFSITGAGPMIEIFNDRIEISNPGLPLVDTNRFLDSPPRSRNESLAAFMRRIGVCEERGSGVDKVVFQTELFQLPAPQFEVVGDNTRVVLFSHRPIKRMDKEDRIRACYLHACLKFVNREVLTNTSLRERFGIESQNSAVVTRIIRETLEAGLIRLYAPELKRKQAKYVPFWSQ